MRGGIQAAFVDVDGTCVFCEARNQRAIEKAAEDGGFTLTSDHWHWFIGTGDKAIYHKIMMELDSDPLRKKRFSDLYETAEDFELACLDYYYQKRHDIEANPHVYSLVQDFMQYAVPVMPVSNAMRTAVCDNLEMSGYPVEAFPFVLSKDDMEAVGLNIKPEPDPYLYALQLHNRDRMNRGERPLEPEECLVIEDSRTGAAAGVAAGMNTVQIVEKADDALDPALYQGKGGIYKPCYADDLACVVQSIDQKLITRRPDYRPDPD